MSRLNVQHKKMNRVPPKHKSTRLWNFRTTGNKEKALQHSSEKKKKEKVTVKELGIRIALDRVTNVTPVNWIKIKKDSFGLFNSSAGRQKMVDKPSKFWRKSISSLGWHVPSQTVKCESRIKTFSDTQGLKRVYRHVSLSRSLPRSLRRLSSTKIR